MLGKSLVAFSCLFIAACASTAKVDMEEPKRVLGRENDVRLDAQIYGDALSNSAQITIVYEVENLRQKPILIADLIPESSFDSETRMITIGLGSEVPGNELVPRLIRINAGEKKSFTTAARVRLITPATGPTGGQPRFLRLRLNFLNNDEPFAELIGIPERAVASRELASKLFPSWLESNEVLYTNEIPITWRGGDSNELFESGRRRRP